MKVKKRIRTIIAIFAVLCLLTGVAFANTAKTEKIVGPNVVGKPVKPAELTIDLRKIPAGSPWKEGQPIIVAPGQPSEIAGTSAGTNGVQQQPIQQTNQKQVGKSAISALTDPISAPIINIEGIVMDGVIPPDTNGAAGPNHFIQTVNDRFAIFDKSGNVLVGKSGNIVTGVDINRLWIDAGQGSDPCGVHNDGDPVVKYDVLADRWLITQFVAFSNFCVAVSKTPDPVTGGWFLYDFPTNGIINDYPKYGVWPDAYYVGTNNGAGGGDAWAFDRTNMLTGAIARAPIEFDLGGRFMLPSDLDGQSPPAGAPNVFVRAAGGNHLELRAFHVDFSNPPASTFTPLPDIPVNAFNSIFCGGNGFRIPCIPQPGTSQLLDVLNNELMYRLQYRNFGSFETLVVNHDINVGNNQAANRWYELHKSGGTWSLFQQGTNQPDSTNRWMGSIAMDKFGDLALGYTVSSKSVFPGIRYAGRLSTDPLGTLEAENTLIAGGGSQLPCGFDCGNRWGDYSSMSVDPVDGCTFWYTSEYYPQNSPGGWHTRIGTFGYCGSVGSISGQKFNDVNGNGVKDPGDLGLPGWTIVLTKPDGTTDTRITDGSGNYKFDNLLAGKYTIGEQIQNGYIQTDPGVSKTGSAVYTVNLNPGVNVIGKDFGNFKLGTVSGTKFQDLDADSIKDPNEVGLPGWQITITGRDTIENVDVTQTATTDPNGNYNFGALTAGNYAITETLQPGWVQTAPSSRKYTVIITSGATISSQDFGNFHKGDITGGGFITVNGGKATFGIVGHYPGGSSNAQGDIEYHDNIANLNIKSTQINTVSSTLDKKKGIITGIATVNGKGSFPFSVYVEDNAEPGKGADKFQITLPTYPYSSGASATTLGGGNIQIHG